MTPFKTGDKVVWTPTNTPGEVLISTKVQNTDGGYTKYLIRWYDPDVPEPYEIWYGDGGFMLDLKTVKLATEPLKVEDFL